MKIQKILSLAVKEYKNLLKLFINFPFIINKNVLLLKKALVGPH